MKRVAWPPQSSIATTRSFDLTEPANEITTHQQTSHQQEPLQQRQQHEEEQQFKAIYQQTNPHQQFSDKGSLQQQQQEEEKQFKEVTAVPVRLETPEPVYEPVQQMPEPVQLINDEMNELPQQQQQQQQINAVPIKIPPPVPPKPILRRDSSRDTTSEQVKYL